jgi:general secretion pathway protein E
LLTATVKGVLAQRLVRRLCPQCKRPIEAPAKMIEHFHLDRRTEKWPIILHQAVGCAACRETGYQGRLAIAEFLVPDERIEQLIFSHAGHDEIEQAAIAAGMVPMFDAGLDVALAGETTLKEVMRTKNRFPVSKNPRAPVIRNSHHGFGTPSRTVVSIFERSGRG